MKSCSQVDTTGEGIGCCQKSLGSLMSSLADQCLLAHPYVYCLEDEREFDGWTILLLFWSLLLIGERFATDGTNLLNDVAKTTATALIGKPKPKPDPAAPLPPPIS
ncbi:uncharacterized protein LOC111123578 isoform X2 [Crassostrea virginica]